MLANIRKSQEDGWVWGVTYKLDAELELTSEEHHVIERHGLAGRVIFDSENVDYYADATAESASSIGYIQPTKEPFIDIMVSFYTSLYHIGATAYNAIQWSFSITITVQSLLDGVQIETDNHEEILLVESLIENAVAALDSHVKALGTFDGQDRLIEPE
jgi:hypothetical protein